MTGIFFRTLIIYILLLTVLRVLGKRQVGELEVSELVSTLLLSEIAALPIDNSDIPLLSAVIPILLILSLEIIITFLKNKSVILKRLFEMRPTILIDKGELKIRELTRARMSVEELLGELRLKGATELSDVYYAILEESGQMSVILRQEKQPLTAEGLITPEEERGIAHPLILDGAVCTSNLERLGKSEGWLISRLKDEGVTTGIDGVFLCTVNDADEFYIIKRKKA